jgi:pimeloyl-ACP methyl ester carboxylesterase
LRYRFETNLYLKDYQGPIVIFHGKQDNLIHYSSSLKLQEDFKDQVTLIILEGQGHNGMTDNPDYKTRIAELLQ